MFSWLKSGRTLLGLALAIYAADSGVAQAQESCGTCLACRSCCPIFCPHYKHCAEGAPRICIMNGCPKPLCNPCTMPNWGYYQTCWSPWPWGPDWSHCPVPTPASQVFVPGQLVTPNYSPLPPTLPISPTPSTVPNRLTPRPIEPDPSLGPLPPLIELP